MAHTEEQVALVQQIKATQAAQEVQQLQHHVLLAVAAVAQEVLGKMLPIMIMAVVVALVLVFLLAVHQ